MAEIPCVSPETASEEIKTIYQDIGRATGGWIPDFYQSLAQRPALLEGFWRMQGELIFKGKVDRRHREMVNIYVSLRNGCEYCLYHHTALGLRVGLTQEKIDTLRNYADNPLLDPLEKLLLRFADEYLSQGRAGPATVAELKQHYSDEQMVELGVILGIVNMVNRFITSYGIEIEEQLISAKDAAALKKRMGR